jgi:hypothetical protein
VVLKEKREAFALWPQEKDQNSREKYKRKWIDARTIIIECKEEANIRWGERVTSEFRESKKIFWESVKRKSKPKEKLDIVLNDENGEILHEKEQVVEGWSEYFVSLLNVENYRKGNLAFMEIGGATHRKL